MIIHGDCMEVMPTIEAESIDSIVTDPPYGLSFMGKNWDHGVPGVPFWSEALRVAKPGAHLLAFGGTRTFHSLTCAIENAGWEIRDCVMWVYGSGFPKSHNLKGEWKGWGTALKPAWEPIIVARKPLVGSVAANVAEYGCGGLNVDGCRIAGEPWKSHFATGLGKVKYFTQGETPEIEKNPHDAGRWPANLIHDGSDEVTGLMGDAARFFYCAKASKADRDEGCEGLDMRRGGAYGEFAGDGRGRQTEHQPQRNHHPTVKPTDLMRYLCRLVTPPGGTVLDPFCGSGSTGKAATLEGFKFIGIEREAEYVAISQARLEHARSKSL